MCTVNTNLPKKFHGSVYGGIPPGLCLVMLKNMKENEGNEEDEMKEFERRTQGSGLA